MTDDEATYVAITVNGGIGTEMPMRLRTKLLQVEPGPAVPLAGSGLNVLAGIIPVLRAATMLALACSGTSLLLTMIGLYGIAAQLVEARRREIGMRLALGATRKGILTWVLRAGLRPVAEGLAIAATIAATGGTAIVLTRGPSTDFVYVLVGGLLISAVGICLAAVAATCVPAHRASRLDPAALLRSQ